LLLHSTFFCSNLSRKRKEIRAPTTSTPSNPKPHVSPIPAGTHHPSLYQGTFVFCFFFCFSFLILGQPRNIFLYLKWSLVFSTKLVHETETKGKSSELLIKLKSPPTKKTKQNKNPSISLPLLFLHNPTLPAFANLQAFSTQPCTLTYDFQPYIHEKTWKQISTQPNKKQPLQQQQCALGTHPCIGQKPWKTHTHRDLVHKSNRGNKSNEKRKWVFLEKLTSSNHAFMIIMANDN
jgi:hypothetical protein